MSLSVQRVATVTGPLSIDELGFTLIHEHVSVASAGIWQVWPSLFGGRSALVDQAARELRRARQSGVDTIVDATTVDLGRDVRLLREVADRSEVRIIASTGHWLDNSRTITNCSIKQLEMLFRTEIEEGIEGTEVRAGVIKVATDEPMNAFGERLLRAAARVCKATGIPIITHSDARQHGGVAQANVFAEEGTDPRKIVIGHSDDSVDILYLKSLLDNGYWLGMDRLPLGAMADQGSPSVAERLATVCALLQSGFANQLLLSHDDPIHLGIAPPDIRRRYRVANPDGIGFLSRKFIPALLAAGVHQTTVRQLTISNPRDLFSTNPHRKTPSHR